MNQASQIAKNILLFVDHHNLLESQKSKLIDDPLFDGQKEFPDVTLNNRKKLHESEQGGVSDEDSKTETIYVDSDYEIDNDDDLIYMHNVDDMVHNEMSVKTRK
ncbi:hypothetical protein C2845_PM09G10350 [Panicum miliaceum]|uniref:Uncharacterized protein n=1 Tax=Panicum miliaceum TaxID=4540 RepID=A0A3L6S3H7_PANMI|nr:hypothetical protein C2845_PM09G10350 [Panicum miliaceum]